MKTNLFRTIFLERGLSVLRSPFAVLLIALAMAVSCDKENEDAITDALSPAAPTGLQVATNPDNRSATLSWQPVNGADGYELSVIDGLTYAVFGASIEIPDLDYDTDYTWKVRAKKKSAYSEWSVEDVFRINSIVVSAPAGLDWQGDENTLIATLTWSHPDADSYDLLFNGVASAVTESRATVTVAPNKNYTWKVRAKKDNRYSDWTQTQVLRLNITVSAPTGLQQAVNGTSATLTWNPVAGADGYEIDLSGTTHTATAAQYVTGVEPGTNYTWKVRAIKKGVPSDWSEPAGFETTPSEIPAPANLQEVINGTSATLTWNSVADANSYEIDVNGETNPTAETQYVISVTPGANYTWKVRAVKEGRYSNWAEHSFAVPEFTFSDKITGTWSVNDINFTFSANNATGLYEEMINRSPHKPSPVTITVTVSDRAHVTLRGADVHITGGVPQDDFDIDSQLTDVRLFGFNGADGAEEGSIEGYIDITAHNVCKLHPNVKISNIPNASSLLGSTAYGYVKNNYIRDMDFRIDRVWFEGTLGGDGRMTFKFWYDVTVTRVTHDISSTTCGLLNLFTGKSCNDVHTMLPPILLISEETYDRQ